MGAWKSFSIVTEQVTQKLTQVDSRLGLLNFEIASDFPGEVIVDFSVTWNGRSFLLFTIHEDGVIAAFSQKFACLLEVPHKVAAFHA